MFLMIIGTLSAVLVVYFIPKRVSRIELYSTALFASLFGTLSDLFLDVKYDWYGYFKKGVDWAALPSLILFYPALCMTFINFYPYNQSLMNKIIYLIGFSILSVILEYIAIQTELFYHNEWKLIYSAICYPFVYMILLLNARVSKMFVNHTPS